MVLRLVLACVSITGFVVQVVYATRSGLSLLGVLTYFTVLTNWYASVLFILGAVRLARARPTDDLAALRGAAVVYLVFVGLVSNLLLPAPEAGNIPGWVVFVHHVLMPVAVVVDWVAQPPTRRIPPRAALAWLVFPLAYLGYSLIRGATAGDYSYPFFDPDRQGGYDGVALYWLFAVEGVALVGASLAG